MRKWSYYVITNNSSGVYCNYLEKDLVRILNSEFNAMVSWLPQRQSLFF